MAAQQRLPEGQAGRRDACRTATQAGLDAGRRGRGGVALDSLPQRQKVAQVTRPIHSSHDVRPSEGVSLVGNGDYDCLESIGNLGYIPTPATT